MRTLLIALALCFCATAQNSQLTITVQGTTATQAILYYVAPDSGACSVKVSESSSYSPLVGDIDPALFAGADSDASLNVLPAGPARLVRIGLRTAAPAIDGRWHSRALAADTHHYVQVNCGGSIGTAEFTTGVPRGYAPEPLPTNPGGWGNLAYPEFDFTDLTKPVIDPQSGIKIYSEDPKAWSMSAVLPLTPGWYGGANGWSGVSSVSSYAQSMATTLNTNPISIYVDTTQFSDGFRISGGSWPFDNFLDLGVDLYGSGSDGQNSANRGVQIALSLDSGQTPYTKWVDAVLPSVLGAAGTFPTQYPMAYFGGWGKVLPRNSWPTRGSVTVSGGVVTLTKNDSGGAIGSSSNDVNSYFVHEWAAGTKIWINNSAPTCTGGFCTIASVQNATHLTLVENLTLAENSYRSAALAVMIRKTTASGSVSLSAQLRIAKGYPHNLWSGGCASQSVTSSDGIVGYPCVFPKVRQDSGGLFFVGSSKPVIRLVSLFRNPGSIAGHVSADLPSGAITLLGPGVASFDPADPTIIYSALPTNGGSVGLFKIQYTGTWAALDIAYKSGSVVPPSTNELVWTNMTKSADGRDMRSQILANTTYDESQWGALNSLQAVGVTGKYSAFLRSVGQQESACWVFAFDSSTGTFFRAFRTDDGSSLPGLKYAGCHSVIPVDGSALFLSTNGLRWSNASMPYGGPFSAPITGILRSGSFDTQNTALPWPPAEPPAANGYDSACPADLSAASIANGAKGNQCVTVLTEEPCSAFPTAGELAASPCPWDPAKSLVAPLAEGDFLKPSTDWDAEGFMVVRKTSLGGGKLQLILQRNANYSYCAMGKDGVGGLSQYIHANGWIVNAAPPGACSAAGIIIDLLGPASFLVNRTLILGHFDLTGTNPGSATWIASGDLGSTPVYRVSFNRPFSQAWAPADFATPQTPPFAGYNSVHDVQSYVDAKQIAATPELRRFAFDFRHYDGFTGVDLEAPNQALGNPTNLVLQPGTSAVYKISYTGTPDAKRGIMNVWAGDRVLTEKSSADLNSPLTDADAWRFCYVYVAGECRSGSAVRELYAVIPGADIKTNCWASQLSLHVPCAMAGPDQAMHATQVRIDKPDPSGSGQRILSSLLMGPNQQYVYSKVLPTPDASYLLFAGFLIDGYHTGLMAAKLPPTVESSTANSTYVPVTISGRSDTSAYVEFGYQEYGNPGDFYCTPRHETCRVAAPLVNESVPFFFAHEPFTPAKASYKISIPALPGRIVYYRLVDGGVAGQIQAAAVPGRLGR